MCIRDRNSARPLVPVGANGPDNGSIKAIFTGSAADTACEADNTTAAAATRVETNLRIGISPLVKQEWERVTRMLRSARCLQYKDELSQLATEWFKPLDITRLLFYRAQKASQTNENSSYLLIPDDTNRKRLGSCLLYTSPSPRDLSTSRMPSSA